MDSPMRRGARLPLTVLALALAAWIVTGPSAFAHGGVAAVVTEVAVDTVAVDTAGVDTAAADITVGGYHGGSGYHGG